MTENTDDPKDKDEGRPYSESEALQRVGLAMIGAIIGQGMNEAQRASVLRACRHRIEHMERELEILQDRLDRKVPGAQIAYDIVHAELELLAGAVRIIWQGGD